MTSEVPLRPSNFLHQSPSDSWSLEFQLTSRQLSDFDIQLLLYALFKPWALSAVLQTPFPDFPECPFHLPTKSALGPFPYSPLPERLNSSPALKNFLPSPSPTRDL